jgi:NAD-dependent dihydropyrimidine dehydrogenase PreA subunit
MNTITIDLETCSGCKTCVRGCFVNVLCWDKTKKKPVISHPEDCVHCNVCELACLKKCITVIPDFASMMVGIVGVNEQGESLLAFKKGLNNHV